MQQSWLVSFTAGLVLLTVGGCNNQPPGAPLAPVGDSNILTNTMHRYSAYPNNQDGGSYALRFNWDDGDTSGWTGSNYTRGVPAVDSHSWSSSGIYHVRAQARDDRGRFSAWSDSLEVTATSPGDEPPDTPDPPLGPDSGLVYTDCTFRANTTDDDNDSLAYRFDWGAGDTSEWLGPLAAGETLSVTHAWESPGTYEVRVQAEDVEGFGVTSDWSGPHTIAMR